ncbi:PAS domain-containing sensor histidine kinase [Nodosilinea sp. FACHB-131]|uniref:PAS domain-containing sensor histidine kinase n=1 Tax=Cyanophyceae TaxID=3028117 RepID=UPI0016850451|nr:PAS domain-containing sensor histidine kinase [Nodosilinea sp. FACHB-131]MBD1873147.1 PAS domain-containing sensor histidine kinase [Nodosilinea sp. FACHB-131]
MVIFAFLLGLAAGALLLLWQQRQQRRRERRLIETLQATDWSTALGQVEQLVKTQPQQQRQLRSLGTSRDTLERILQTAPIGYLQVDEENQLIWCNDQANRLLKMNQPLTGPVQRRRLLLEVARSYELDALIEETREKQTCCQREWMLYQISPDPLHPKEEPTFPLRGYAIPLDGGEVGVFLENRQEAALLVQQRDRWTSDVAHELKTPLTSIRLVAETLQPRVDESQRRWLDRLVNETIRLSNLVEDLLNLSRLQGDQFQGLSLKPVDLPQLVQRAWVSLEPLAEVKALKLAYAGPSHCLASLDEPLFHRVLLNLIDNAIKHSPSRATVYVRLSEPRSALTLSYDAEDAEPDTLILDVMDMGPGFNAKDLPYIFDRFYRADPSRTRTDPLVDLAPINAGTTPEIGRGTGLGLAIVSQIIEAHNGTITAANHPELGGGWLRLRLPATQSE